MSVRVLRPTSSLLYKQALRQSRPGFVRHSRASSTQSLDATRTLPYSAIRVYDIIADIDKYPHFLPFCSNAKVHEWSGKDEFYQRQWPQRASLTIGYGEAATESFVSRVYCVPPIPEEGRAGVGVCEAVSGDAQHATEQDHIKHHTHGSESRDAEGSDMGAKGPLESLKTRWTVRSFPFKPAESGAETNPASKERTDVTLRIEYKFSNAVYEMMSRAVASTVAEKMIEAFEQRCKTLLEK